MRKKTMYVLLKGLIRIPEYKKQIILTVSETRFLRELFVTGKVEATIAKSVIKRKIVKLRIPNLVIDKVMIGNTEYFIIK